uniref:Ig-like domain-containing protein n=1 Tax=Chelonoidis abingdonii TaxID=106734 RepID=A0A8C0H1D8_CHEAB
MTQDVNVSLHSAVTGAGNRNPPTLSLVLSLSHTTGLRTASGSYPKPSISVSPSEVIPVGGNVTIWCWHQLLDMRILLYKDEDENYLHYTDPAGSEAEFPITSARREHGGSYTCRYSNRTGEVAYSEPSDPVQIIVAGEGPSPAPRLPRPSISLSPTGVTAPGADVTIWCQGQRRDVRFFLHKAGDLNPQRHMDPAGAGAEFHIPTVGQQHGGNYSCSYRPQSEPFVSSQPSDTVELVVAGEGLIGSWGILVCVPLQEKESHRNGAGRNLDPPPPDRPAWVTGLLGSVPARGGEGCVTRSG